MQNLIRLSFLLSLFFPLFGMAQDSRTVDLDVPSIKDWLTNAPNENSAAAANTAIVIDLPLVNGENISVKVLESPMVFNNKSGIRTYSFIGFEDPSYSGRLMVSDRGLDVHMLAPNGRFLIEPTQFGVAAHTVTRMTGEYPHLANDALRPDGYVHKHAEEEQLHEHDATARNLAATPYDIGAQIRKFRMHVIVDREYSLAATNLANPTRAQVFAAITAAVNAMNVLYVRDMAVLLTLDEASQTIYIGANPNSFVAQGAAQIWHNESLAHHGFLEGNSTSDGAGGTNPVVPRNSYDVGHLFSGRVQANTGGGGVAFLAGVCTDDLENGGPLKAGAGSGVEDPEGSSWVDLLAHEFTHQFNADHTWSGDSGFCTSNQFSTDGGSAYEPGGGSTIVSYATICDEDNIPNQGNTSYYHTNSIKQVDDWIEGAATCEINVASGNQVPDPSTATSGCIANYVIPIRTPFYIAGSATDGNTPLSQLTYTWEQFNNSLDRFDPIDGPGLKNGNNLYPIFRSFAPSSSASRTFPQISTLLSGKYNGDAQNAAALTQANWQGELLPEVTGNITMRLTVRDNNTTAGGVEVEDLDIAVAGSMPFSVTSQNSSPPSVAAGNTMNVTWTLAGTDAAPFNHSTVTIKLSVDGGETFPFNLGSTVNDGSESITIPNGIPGTTKARIRVEAGTECFYFFDINNADFTITNVGCAPNGASFTGSSDVTAEAGNASLDLSLMPVYGTTLSSKTVTTTGSSPTVALTVNNGSGSCQNNFGQSNPYAIIEFFAPATNTYSFTLSNVTIPTSVLNLYNDPFSNSSSCSNWIASSTTSSIAGGAPIQNVNLIGGKKYILVVSGAEFGSGNTGSATINFSPAVAEGGAPNPGANYTYTYAAINSSSVISKIDAGADFTSLAGGGEMYTVYGFSVLTTDLSNFIAQEGQSFTNLSNGTYCAGISSNTIKLTVTGGGGGSTGQGEGTCLAGDTVEPSEIPGSAGTYAYNSSSTLVTSGEVEINSGYDVTFTAGTSITLNPGFEAKAGSVFLAKIDDCTPALQEEEEVLTVHRYSPETEEVIAIDTKPTAVTTTVETPAFSELDLKIAPNPARDFTNLTFNLGKSSTVNMTIYDMSGRAVESMIQGQAMNAGWHQIQYTPQSIKGGMYYVVLQADKEVVTKKMILVR